MEPVCAIQSLSLLSHLQESSLLQKWGKRRQCSARTVAASSAAAAAMRINDQDQKGTLRWLVRGDTEVVKDTRCKTEWSTVKCILGLSSIIRQTYISMANRKHVKHLSHKNADDRTNTTRRKLDYISRSAAAAASLQSPR